VFDILLGGSVSLFCSIGIAAASVAETGSMRLSAEEVSKRLGIGSRVLISTWNAGFPSTMAWRDDHVIAAETGGVALRLSRAPEGAERPFQGGEYQTSDYSAVWGRVEWQARLPKAPSGSVAAMFLYMKPFDAKALRELDFEYVPGDPTVDHALGTMQMALHMKRHDGTGEKEVSAYRIEMPERCVEQVCGWAIEFQPKYVTFQMHLNQGGEWETIGAFEHGAGWDPTTGQAWGGSLMSSTRNFSSDDVWSEQTMNAFVSYWATNDSVGWLGRLDEKALRTGIPDFVLKSITPTAYDSLSDFQESDWSLNGEGLISIHGMPEDGLAATAIEYRLDGGDWRALGPAEPGQYALEEVAPGQMVEIRTVARGPAFEDSRYEIVSGPSEARPFPTY
jgi:hypothetical protein